MTIQESNKLIADFMGKKLVGGFYQIEKRPYSLNAERYPANLKYHLDWQWLMPVVDKIESLTTKDGRGDVPFVVTIEPGYCRISYGGEGIVIETQDYESPKITVVCQTVVDFIKWWNEYKNDEQ